MAINIAGQQILSQPVSGFLQGRAMRAAEDQGERRMRALEAAEGRAQAQDAREQELFDESAKMRNMQVLHRALSQIETSQDPIATARMMAQSPEVAEIFQRMGKDPMEGWAGKTPEQVKAAAAEGRSQIEPFLPKEKVEPLSPEGKVATDVKRGILTNEQGNAALTKENKLPNSFQEFTLSEQDPKYAAFLEKNRGKGIRINPDGTIEIGGTAGGVGPGELAKPTINNLQETIVNSSNRLDRLNLLLSSYKPEYLQARGLLKAGTTELKDFLNMDIPEEDKKFLRGYSEFKASASQEFSATLKELSGTAASEGEVARVMKGLPTDQDKSPEVFESKARATTKFITRAIMRSNWALKNGIGVKSVEQLAKVMPIEGIDAVYEQRANEIWQELGGTPQAKAQAIKQANEEFGLAR